MVEHTLGNLCSGSKYTCIRMIIFELIKTSFRIENLLTTKDLFTDMAIMINLGKNNEIYKK